MTSALKESELGPLVSMRRVSWLLGMSPDELRSLAEQADELYRPFDLKRPGKKPRRIDQRIDPLKRIQSWITNRILKSVSLPFEVMGGVAGRSTKSNAQFHTRKSMVVGLDIHNYFGSVTNAHVAEMWRTVFHASSDVAWVLTRLTTYKGHLPQGSPASTALANLVYLPIDREIKGVCEPRGIQRSIWVDDLAISGANARALINDIALIFKRHGFSIARKKTEVMPQHQSQRVTGHVVNAKVSNGRKRLQATWAELQALLGKSLPVTDSEVSRARGLVAHATSTCQRQGRHLQTVLIAIVNKRIDDHSQQAETKRLENNDDNLQKPGEKPNKPGEYGERGPRGGEVPNPREVTIEPRDPKLPPTQEPGRKWQHIGPPKPDKKK